MCQAPCWELQIWSWETHGRSCEALTGKNQGWEQLKWRPRKLGTALSIRHRRGQTLLVVNSLSSNGISIDINFWSFSQDFLNVLFSREAGGEGDECDFASQHVSFPLSKLMLFDQSSTEENLTTRFGIKWTHQLMSIASCKSKRTAFPLETF